MAPEVFFSLSLEPALPNRDDREGDAGGSADEEDERAICTESDRADEAVSGRLLGERLEAAFGDAEGDEVDGAVRYGPADDTRCAAATAEVNVLVIKLAARELGEGIPGIAGVAGRADSGRRIKEVFVDVGVVCAASSSEPDCRVLRLAPGSTTWSGDTADEGGGGGFSSSETVPD